MTKKPFQVLTVAGSDSGGGAGIQADIKTLNTLNVFSSSVITCITAQNSFKVNEILRLPNKTVKNQIQTVMSDYKIKFIKLGMLYDSKMMKIILESLNKYKGLKIVSDPVMVSKSGNNLLLPSAIKFFRNKILPICFLITPNIFEANKIYNCDIKNESDIYNLDKLIFKQKKVNVLIKGGHLSKNNQSCDYLFHNKKIYKFSSKRYDTINTHGTGCTLSAAITGYLSMNYSLLDSVKKGKEFVSFGIKNAFNIGKGCGPLNHFPRRKR